MKRLVLTLAVALVTALSASAQRLANIQVEARFITDKMVLELGLSNVQRNNIMRLNLDYLDAINSYRDLNGRAWKYRNKELRRMMSDSQWRRYREAYYFYQPISWRGNRSVQKVKKLAWKFCVVKEICIHCDAEAVSAYKLARQRLRTQHLHQVSRKSGCRTRVVQALQASQALRVVQAPQASQARQTLQAP